MTALKRFLHSLLPCVFFILSIYITMPLHGGAITTSGIITSNETWSGIIILTGDVIVEKGAKLTIQPGTIVKFKPDGENRYALLVKGTLSAIGTEAQKIIFTSYYDDTEGGDTNGDGAATQPSAKESGFGNANGYIDDWKGIVFSDSSDDEQCILQFCKLKYSGNFDFYGSSKNGFVNCESASPQILNCQFDSGHAFGMRCLMNSNPVISQCTFKTIVLDGIYCNGVSSPQIKGNTFSACRVALHKELDTNPAYSDNVLKSGVMKGIGISGSCQNAVLKQDNFGSIDNIPYIVLSDITVNGNMTILPGVIVKFKPDGENRYALIVKGTLSAIGTEAQKIIFTSLYDDTEGGDTNGDGAATQPSAKESGYGNANGYIDDWKGIVFSDSSDDEQCILKFCKLKYSGNFDFYGSTKSGFINCESASPQILNCQFDSGHAYGMRCLINSNPAISQCTFKTIVFDGIYCNGVSSPQIMGNTFSACRVALHKELDTNPVYSDNVLKSGVMKGIGISGSCQNAVLKQDNFGSIDNIPYIVLSDITVNGNMTISPGVIVKFKPDGENRYALLVKGTLSAIGTEAQKIIFTSYYDDTEGGDTNGDGAATQPSAKESGFGNANGYIDDWKGIVFSDSSDDEQCILQFCKLKYSGNFDFYGSSKNGFVNCESASPQILNCQFDSGHAFGMRCLMNSNPVISQCTFKTIVLDGIYCSGVSSPQIKGNTFSACRVALHKELDTNPAYSDNVLKNGVMKGIGISGSCQNAVLKQDNFGSIDNIPYIVLSDITVNGNMTISPGVIVKFKPDGENRYALIVKGTLSSIGTEAQKIIFTSLYDDTEGGDTNGDGAATQPSAKESGFGNANGYIDDWKGIVFSDSSDDEQCILQFCKLKYSGNFDFYGSAKNGFVNCESASPQILNCQFANGNAYGIRCLTNSNPILTCSLFNNIAKDWIYSTGSSTPIVSNECNSSATSVPVPPTFTSVPPVPTATRTAVSVPTNASQNGIVLSENFDGVNLDPRISLITKGNFIEYPGVKPVDFIENKSFGFGRTDCTATCHYNAVTSMNIIFFSGTYVSSIEFDEIELFDNWGSRGEILIDGEFLTPNMDTSKQDFGRDPQNDRIPDTSSRHRSFVINKNVSIIAIRVADITDTSEIFIDNLAIWGDMALPTKGISTPIPTSTPVPTATFTSINTSVPMNTPTATSTLTPAVFEIPQNTLYVMDDINSTGNLAGKFDQDSEQNRCLVLRWNFDPSLEGLIKEYHVYVKVNNYTQQFMIVIRNQTWFEWRANVKNISGNFIDGPLYGGLYQFSIFAIDYFGQTKGSIEKTLPVYFISDRSSTPTPSATPSFTLTPTATPTATPLPVIFPIPVDTVIVTDDMQSKDDLCGKFDADDLSNKSLAVRWNFERPWAEIFHVYVSRDGGQYQFIEGVPVGQGYYLWTNPEYGHRYQFMIYCLKYKGMGDSESIFTKGAVYYISNTDKTPTATSTPTVTPTSTRTYTQTPVPTSTPVPLVFPLPADTVIITDDLQTQEDLTGKFDADESSTASLAIRWNFYRGGIELYHIFVSKDGGQFEFIDGVTPDKTYYLWLKPEFGHRYQFMIYCQKYKWMGDGESIVTNGNVLYMSSTDKTPTPTLTYTPTNTPTPTSTFTPTPVVFLIPENTIIITDDLQTTEDLSGKTDIDEFNQRALAIRWNIKNNLYDQYHIYVKKNNGKMEFICAAEKNISYYLWTSPEFGYSYTFLIYGIRTGESTLLLESSQPVYLLSPADNTPVQTSTPIPASTPISTQTPTPVLFSISENSIVVTDDLQSIDDLLGKFDADTPDARALAIRWKYKDSGFTGYHVYVIKDGGQPEFLDGVPAGSTYYLWKNPEFGHSYQFRIWGVLPAGGQMLESSKPVFYISTTDPTPANTFTPTNTVAMIPTPVFTSTPVIIDTPTPTATATFTYTPVYTNTATETFTPTVTATFTSTLTFTPTATPIPSPTVTATPVAKDCLTLVILSKSRLEDLYGADRTSVFLPVLQNFLSHETVRGEIIDLDEFTTLRDKYKAWDADSENLAKGATSDPRENVKKANTLAEMIKGIIGSKRTEKKYAKVEYVMMIGSDAVIPFYRAQNQSRSISSEYNYYKTLDRTHPLAIALSQENILSDDFYSDAAPVWMSDATDLRLFLPNELMIGRLVETPEEMTAMINAYIALNGIVDFNKGMVAGSDTYTNGADLAVQF